MKKVIIGSDHAGYQVKEQIKKELSNEYEFIDLGTDGEQAVDYPIYGEKVARQVSVSPDARGVLICGSGEGIMMAANKVKGVRAGLGYSNESARGMREHNNANIIAIPGRNAMMDDPAEVVRTFLESDFSAEDRHHRRVDQMMEIESHSS
jgi:ribose 5-phosphate isomerase B